MSTRPARTSRFLPFFFVAALGPLSGCGHLAESVPRAAVPGVLKGSIEGMDDPATKQKLEHLLASPEVKVIQRELVADILDGSLSALSDEKRVERVGDLTARYAASLVHGFSKEVGPEINGMMSGAMGATMSEANQRAMARMVSSLVQASIDPVVKSLSEADLSTTVSTAMTKDLGPAIQKVLRENLAPGLAEAMTNPEFQRAMGDTVHMLGREMILGANEGLSKVQENKAPEDSSLLGSISSLAHQGATATKFLPWLLGALALILAVWVIRLLSQTRRYQTEAEHRAETTRVLTEALAAGEGKSWSGELYTALEDRFRADEEALLRIRAARLGRARKSV